MRTCNTTSLPCVGSNYEVSSCNSSINCPVDGTWTAWSNYSDCTTSCGAGIQTRTRACVNQAYGGQTCVGSAVQSIVCNTSITCPGLNVLFILQSVCMRFLERNSWRPMDDMESTKSLFSYMWNWICKIIELGWNVIFHWYYRRFVHVRAHK